MQQILGEALKEALQKADQLEKLNIITPPPITLEVPADKKFGDWSSNLAMVLASQVKKSPRVVAQMIIDNLSIPSGTIARVELAGPGFINFYAHPHWWLQVVKKINEEGPRYGNLTLGQGEKVQVEFVSANPTGPLHVGHGRGAAVGDALANLLEKAGFTVQKEYYINDAGNQMNMLGQSVFLRYQQSLGKEVEFMDNGYKGEYIRGLAQEIIDRDGSRWLEVSEKEAVKHCAKYASDRVLAGIKEDLRNFGVEFDCWFSEQTLFEQGEVDKSIQELKQSQHIVEREGAWWLRSSQWGDEKDRVVIRQNGEPTYYASDIAYHWDKIQRGFTRIINIWGADHHGYVSRIKAAVGAMGYNPKHLEVILVQLVRLLRDGKPIAMSTRQGEFITLSQVVGEVGKDAARFHFLARRGDSQLDFDLELAKKQSAENPVYYVQYAHARICSVLRKAIAARVNIPPAWEIELNRLQLEEETELMKKLTEFPALIAGGANSREVHRLTFYAQELAAQFHRYYNKHRIIGEDEKLSQARIALIKAVQTVIVETLAILGVSAPEEM